MRLFTLAGTLWPRTGGGPGNRSRVLCAGPSFGRVRLRVALAGQDGTRGAGIVVTSDRRLCVAHRGTLWRVARDGSIRWRLELRERRRERPRYHAAPLALVGDRVAVALPRSVQVIDGDGRVVLRRRCEVSLDDSGPSPNVSGRGELVLSAPTGEVLLLGGEGWQRVGAFGFDVVPPAIYADGTLAVSGYAGAGFCRVRRDGAFVWRTNLGNADRVVAINRHQYAAATGGPDHGASAIFSPSGVKVGTYGRDAVFAELSGREWVALSKEHIARLDHHGALRWELPLPGPVDLRWGMAQPIVDRRGCIYVGVASGVLCLDRQGQVVFAVDLGAQPDAIAMAAAGILAVLVQGELLLLE